MLSPLEDTMKVGHARGLSIKDLGGGKWQLRWRQWEEQPEGGRAIKERSVFAYSVDEQRQLVHDIEKALRERGWWARPEAPTRPADLDLEEVAKAWVKWKVGLKGVAPTTRSSLAGSMKRWFTALRVELKLKKDDTISATAMSGRNIASVTVRWRTEKAYAEGTVYQTIAAVVDMWTWAADQTEWAQVVPRPPYNKGTVMPATVMYEAPEASATWAECDEAINRIRLPLPRRAAVIMRYTGLRIEQAAWIHAEDFDLLGKTLLIRKGKSRKEKALMRRVPVSEHLIADLSDCIGPGVTGPLFPDRDRPTEPMKSYRNMTRYVTEAWKAATADGKARHEVWSPPNRAKNRPDHAFRSAFQAVLQEEGIGEGVLNYLVGHTPKTTRGQSYARPGEKALRRAVEVPPAIVWNDGHSANVIPMRRRRDSRVA